MNVHAFPAIRAAAKRAVAMVSKYERLTTSSLVTIVATSEYPSNGTLLFLTVSVLNPCFKTDQFRKLGWSQARIDEAVGRTKAIWVTDYKEAIPLVSTQHQYALLLIRCSRLPMALLSKQPLDLIELHISNRFATN